MKTYEEELDSDSEELGDEVLKVKSCPNKGMYLLAKKEALHERVRVMHVMFCLY